MIPINKTILLIIISSFFSIQFAFADCETGFVPNCNPDFDGDNDLELFAGSTLGVEVFDVKTEGSSEGYWNTHRANQSRTGYMELSGSSSCTTADVNSDGIVDILDIVRIVNQIMGNSEFNDDEFAAADFNGDAIVDILDIVQIVNYILDN